MNTDPAPSRRLEKTSSQKSTPSPGTPIAWPEVLRAVLAAETRLRVTERYRASGFTPADFGTRRRAREAMSVALARVEDWLELEKPGAGDRFRLKALRQRLEKELWP
ncbi:MAG: hypothetical protein IPG50_21765 [Myxococcales bacterium]|nr:hypothetical protein [Myxococcales bacterium]